MVKIYCDVSPDKDVNGADGLYDFAGLLAIAVIEAVDAKIPFDTIKDAIYSFLAFELKYDGKTKEEKARAKMIGMSIREQVKLVNLARNKE